MITCFIHNSKGMSPSSGLLHHIQMWMYVSSVYATREHEPWTRIVWPSFSDWRQVPAGIYPIVSAASGSTVTNIDLVILKSMSNWHPAQFYLRTFFVTMCGCIYAFIEHRQLPWYTSAQITHLSLWAAKSPFIVAADDKRVYFLSQLSNGYSNDSSSMNLFMLNLYWVWETCQINMKCLRFSLLSNKSRQEY